MEEIVQYAGSALSHEQRNGSNVVHEGRARPGPGSTGQARDRHSVQVLWLSSALVEEPMVPKQWKYVTSNKRIMHFNTVAREVGMFA